MSVSRCAGRQLPADLKLSAQYPAAHRLERDVRLLSYPLHDYRKALFYLRQSYEMLRPLEARGYYGYPLSFLACLYADTVAVDLAHRARYIHVENKEEIGSRHANREGLLRSRNIQVVCKRLRRHTHSGASPIRSLSVAASADEGGESPPGEGISNLVMVIRMQSGGAMAAHSAA